MSGCKRLLLVLVVSAWCVSQGTAQVTIGDRPTLIPIQPPTQKEADRREALKEYVLGLLCEKDDRLLEALQAFQRAVKLDPEAPAVFKAQVPLLLALDRGPEALAAIARTVQLDPADYESWYLNARLLKVMGKSIEARLALQKGLATTIAKQRPEMAQQMYFDLGTMLETEGFLKEAGDAFGYSAQLLDHPDLILEHGPFTRDMVLSRAAEVYERIGHLYRKAKQYDLAVDAFKKAQARFPASAGRLSYNLAQVFLEQNKPAEALTSVDAYLRFQPQGLEAYEMKLALLQKLGRSGDIVPWLEQTSKADPNNVGLKLLLAQQCVIAKDARAEKLFLELAEKAPGSEVYRSLFDLYKQDQAAGATRILNLANKTIERAANKDPDGSANLGAAQARAMVAVLREDAGLSVTLFQQALKHLDRREGDFKFETVHFLAVLADRHRRHEDAERFYRQCLVNVRPGSEALVYGGLLRVLWKSHKYEAVLQTCEEGLKKAEATNRILFHNDRAKALARLERYPEALKESDAAIKLAGDNDLLHVRHLRVRILAQSERYDLAEKECLALLKDHSLPSDIMEIRYLLSGVFTQAKQHAKAEEQLEWILRFDPSNATANNDLGYLWADQNKNLPQAEEMIRKALEQDRRQRKSAALTPQENQDNAAYLDSLGWVLFRKGQIEEAKKELERASALDNGEDPTIWDHLGDVYFRLREYPRAQNAWQKSLQLLEQERRRPQDTRYQDLQRKLKMVQQEVRGR